MSCTGDEYTHDLEKLRRDPGMKYGFIVYRCANSSDKDWGRFMVYLDTAVRASMVKRGMGEMLDRIDWCVQKKRGLNLPGLNMTERV